MAVKMYPYYTNAKCVVSGSVFILIGLLSLYFLQILAPDIYTTPASLVWFVGAAAFFLFMILGLNVREFVFSKEGLFLNRRYKPIIIQKITHIAEKRNLIRLTGITSEGEIVTKRILRSDLGKKRWDEFKEDLKTLMP